MSFIVIKPDILITDTVPFIPNKTILVYLHNSHILKRPGLGKLGPLTHVYRMVSYPFQILGHHQQVNSLVRLVRRGFKQMNHVVLHLIEQCIHLVIPFNDFHGRI